MKRGNQSPRKKLGLSQNITILKADADYGPIFHCLDPVAFVEGHDVVGGPASSQVLPEIQRGRKRLAEARQRQVERRARLEAGEKLLDEAVQRIVANAG